MKQVFPFPDAELSFWWFDYCYYVEWRTKLGSIYLEGSDLGEVLKELTLLGLFEWEIQCINKVGKRTGQWQELWLSAYDRIVYVGTNLRTHRF